MSNAHLHPIFQEALAPFMPCRAKGNHLAAQNDEPEPGSREYFEQVQAETRAYVASAHLTRVESTGTGLSDSAQVQCICGWKGPLRHQYDDDMSTGLRADAAAHCAAPGVRTRDGGQQ